MTAKPIVGLAGGVGSGKSTVAEMFRDLGAAVIESDRLGHEAINEPDVKARLVEWWGPGILAEDGAVNRQAVAGRVFDDPAERQRLEALLHPRIAVLREQATRRFLADSSVPMVVIDSPLLYETGLDAECDCVVFVESNLAERRARSEKSRNWKGDEVVRRENSQWPLDRKRSRAEYICSNNSDLDALRKQIDNLFDVILSRHGKP